MQRQRDQISWLTSQKAYMRQLSEYRFENLYRKCGTSIRTKPRRNRRAIDELISECGSNYCRPCQQCVLPPSRICHVLIVRTGRQSPKYYKMGRQGPPGSQKPKPPGQPLIPRPADTNFKVI